MRLHMFSARFFYHIRELGLFFWHYSHTYKISLASQRDRNIDEFHLKLEFSCWDESEKFYPSKKFFGSTLFPSLFLWKTIWSSEDAMAGIPCSDLKNVPTTWSTRWPPALACRTSSSYSYSRSTEKPCPACHPCTTAGHTTGYKAKVPITLRRIQSRSQGYVP